MTDDEKHRMVLTWHEAEQRWLLTFPELPGALASGLTPQQALANAPAARELWIDRATTMQRPVPPPHTLTMPTG